MRDYVRTGKVKLQARTLHFIGPDSVRAAKVAAGAERQGRLWPFLETFYADQGQENSGYVTDAFLRSVAGGRRRRTPRPRWTAPTARPRRRARRAPTPTRRQLGIDSTPTFTVAARRRPARVVGSRRARRRRRWPPRSTRSSRR